MKKHYIILAIAVIGVAALALLAINKYEHRPKAVTMSQVASDRDRALTALAAERSINANNKTAIATLQQSNSNLTAVNAKLCSQIKAARLNQPLCK